MTLQGRVHVAAKSRKHGQQEWTDLGLEDPTDDSQKLPEWTGIMRRDGIRTWYRSGCAHSQHGMLRVQNTVSTEAGAVGSGGLGGNRPGWCHEWAVVPR